MLRLPRRSLLPFALTALMAARAHAQPGNLADLSLEQLSNLQVTSVNKRAQPLSEVAGSVFIVPGEDIHRAGATTLPEALRLAANLFVARADANQYAVTARTGADLLANKMLVLLDGRTLYSPLFSGVFWDAQDVVTDDIDRIEVLSGSGGTLYGSNAIHGVINVITRPAQQTHGTLARAMAGESERVAVLRYGRATDDGGGWRAWARYGRFDATRRENGTLGVDGGRRASAGFRADRSGGDREWTVSGGLFEHRLRDPLGQRSYRGAHLLARYVALGGDTGRTQLQAYLDRFEVGRPGVISDTMDTLDLDFQRLERERAGHLLIWGGGWRAQRDDARNTAAVALVPPRRNLHLANAFVQDEWKRGSARVTAGLKLEHNGYTGLEFLPNLRLGWQPAPRHLLWAAWSRVVRTPSRIDREAMVPPLQPSPGFVSEVARVAEVGWRGPLSSAISASATLFRHDFSRLRSVDATPAGLTFNNNFEGRLTGVEAWAQARLREGLRVQAGVVHQSSKYAPLAGTAPLPLSPGNDPRTRYQLVVFWDPLPDVDVYAALRRVGRLPQPVVPAYTALDLRAAWKPRRQLELAVLVRNANGSHVEWGAPGTRAQLRRDVFLQLTWTP